ncbi:hypothetical protein QAD02_002026 [Eretmocerus hayati]|uniref:Uncharacterized protein n=1 Tax=Eretmocerus hayati TaxID=131215 RepID=A0ACC2NKL8_9HYME|nr:hypothetical protein QAD02_002026 [Eretmocerus hayati]
MNISFRTPERILQYLKLKRKNIVENDREEIIVATLLELEGSAYNSGYKSMWKRLRSDYGLQVKPKTVWELLWLLDPDGVELRSRYRLKRRVYLVPGPNFLWRADSHDELKRYGFAIYGIIDGFSTKKLCLVVATSNNNPRIIGRYYIELVQKLGYLPTLMRTDHGTEVILVEDFHVALWYWLTFKIFICKSCLNLYFILDKSTPFVISSRF